MVTCAPFLYEAAEEVDLQDAKQRFVHNVLQTSQPVLKRHRVIGRGATRMMRGVAREYVAELRVVVQLYAWERTGLVAAAAIGAPTASELIADVIQRMRASQQEHISSDAIINATASMFIWWYEHCARHAPERIEADVLVRGNVTGQVINELAQVLWSQRHLSHATERN